MSFDDYVHVIPLNELEINLIYVYKNHVYVIIIVDTIYTVEDL